MKRLINHDHLFAHLEEHEARRVYESAEDALSWDHHYWLQRGAFELEYDIRLAENFLGQAYSLASGDALVQTTYAHMRMKKAVLDPRAADVDKIVEGALEILKVQVQLRGKYDPYPFHVLGSQGNNWARVAPWSIDRRKDFLKSIRATVDEGARIHRNSPRYNLKQVSRELERSVLELGIAR